jgi:hypothetical protein
MDHALLLGKILQRGIRIVVATSPSLDADLARKLFLTPAANPQEALESARKTAATPNPRVLFFPQAQRALSVLDAASPGR